MDLSMTPICQLFQVPVPVLSPVREPGPFVTCFQSLDQCPTFSSSRAPSSSRSLSAVRLRSQQSSAEWSRKYSRSSSPARGFVVVWLHSMDWSSVSLQPSFSSAVLAPVESRSPLDAVTMAQSTGTYYLRLSPPAAPSHPVPVHLCQRSAHPSTDVAAGVRPLGVAGVLFSQGSHSHASPPLAPQGLLVSHGKQPGRSHYCHRDAPR